MIARDENGVDSEYRIGPGGQIDVFIPAILSERILCNVAGCWVDLTEWKRDCDERFDSCGRRLCSVKKVCYTTSGETSLG